METVRLKETDLTARFDEYATYVLEGGYLYDQENKEAVISCIDVLKKNKTGLLILGNPGGGKTLIFKMVQRVTPVNYDNAFVIVNCLDVVLQFNDNAVGHLVFNKWTKRNVLFDDLGTEDKGKHFGETVEVFEKFIQFRYDLFQQTGIKTHFTTNLSSDQMNQRYGLRCMSRLNEMCTVVMLGNKSNYSDRRKLRNFKGLPLVYQEPTKQDIDWKNQYEQAKELAKSFKAFPKPIKKQEDVVTDEMKMFVEDQMKEFDKLNRDQDGRAYGGKRFVEFDGKLMDQTEFVEYKFKNKQNDERN